MIRKSGFILFCIFLINSLFTVPVSGQGFLINQVKTLETRNSTINKKYADIAGSPYYTNDFIKSTAYLKGGYYSTLSLRYDMFQDEMEFKKDDQIRWLVKRSINSIIYGDNMLFVTSITGDTSKLGYFFLRDTGNCLLFYRKSVLFKPMSAQQAYAETLPDRFEPQKDEIYFKRGNGPAKKIKTRKDLLSYFADNKAAIDFIKRQKINADELEDLHNLASFINGW